MCSGQGPAGYGVDVYRMVQIGGALAYGGHGLLTGPSRICEYHAYDSRVAHETDGKKLGHHGIDQCRTCV